MTDWNEKIQTGTVDDVIHKFEESSRNPGMERWRSWRSWSCTFGKGEN
jgi:hypothetical protein